MLIAGRFAAERVIRTDEGGVTASKRRETEERVWSRLRRDEVLWTAYPSGCRQRAEEDVLAKERQP
jgi:hypothetical protein